MFQRSSPPRPFHRFAFPVLAVAALLVYAGDAPPAEAGCQAAAKIAVHLEQIAAKNAYPICSLAPADINCVEGTGSDAVIQGAVGQHYAVYFYATNLSTSLGLRSAKFGILYDGAPQEGVDVYGFASCEADVMTGDGWPDSGGNVLFTYPACQNTNPQAPGSFYFTRMLGAVYVYAYGDDALSVVAPAGGHAFVTDCTGDTTIVGALGSAGFGNVYGYDPCTADYYAAPNTCCMGTECVSLPWACCISAGGVPRSFEPCSICQPTPTEPVSWGVLKRRYE